MRKIEGVAIRHWAVMRHMNRRTQKCNQKLNTYLGQMHEDSAECIQCFVYSSIIFPLYFIKKDERTAFHNDVSV